MWTLVYFIFPLLFLNLNFKTAGKKQQIARYIIGFIYSFFIFYIGNVDRSISFLVANIKWVIIVQLILTGVGSLVEKSKVKEVKDVKNNSQWLIAFVFLALIIVSLVFSFMPYIYGGAKNLSKMVDVKENDKQSPKINTENIIVISPETAYYQMQTLIGSLSNPSLYKIGQISLTKTSDGAYYVAPIDIEGNFKALLNRELPGIAYVSAERLEEAKLINVPHKHGQSLVFNNNIYRKLRASKPTAILLNANIELDDNLKPYYVGSYGHYKYGRNGIVIDGVLLYDTENGEVKDYSKDNVPSWVDQFYTSEVAEDYNSYFGKLQNGFLNSVIGQKGVHIPTEWETDIDLEGFRTESKQVIPVIGNNGEFYYFTDHTNTSSTSTTMTGYTLMDTRTGTLIYYKTPGYLNGQGAMNSVEKLLGANKSNWTTSQPILYNIYGVDTWIIPIINKTDGSFVKIGLVTAQSKFTILSDSKVELLEQFKKAIADGTVNQNGDVKVKDKAKMKEVSSEGKIVRINQSIEKGQSVFYIKIDSEKDKIFMINKNISADIVLARDGDSIKIKYIDMEGQKIVPITSIELKLQ